MNIFETIKDRLKSAELEYYDQRNHDGYGPLRSFYGAIWWAVTGENLFYSQTKKSRGLK